MFPDADDRIASVIADREIFNTVENRKHQFSAKREANLDIKFSELIFCTLTANTSAEMGIRCQNYLENADKFDQSTLKEALVNCHYRFPNTRSRFIAHNFQKKHLLTDILKSENRRELLIEQYMGIGMKEASHFLRNIGYFQYSILDKHIQRFLSDYTGREIKIRNKRDYEREEVSFFEISSKYRLEPGIMDLVIWYLMTGKILK